MRLPRHSNGPRHVRGARDPVDAGRGYRPASDLSVGLRLLLIAWVVLGGIAVASDLAEFHLLGVRLQRPAFVSEDLLRATDQRQTAIAVLQVLGTVLIAGLFILWTRRIYRNLWPLGVRGMRFRRGWAVGGWLVPVLNLVRPRQIIGDVWRTGDPSVPVGSDRWRSQGVPALLRVWWALWIVGGVIGTWFGMAPTPETVRATRTVVGMTAILDAVHAVAAILGAWTVEQITRRQERLAARSLGFSPLLPAPRLPVSARYSIVAALGIASFTATLVALS